MASAVNGAEYLGEYVGELRATHRPGADPTDPRAPDDTITLEFTATQPLLAGWSLAFTSIVQLTPPAEVCLVERVASYHVIGPSVAAELKAGETWTVGPCRTSHVARHACHGPSAAYVIAADGTTALVSIAPMTTMAKAPDTAAGASSGAVTDERVDEASADAGDPDDGPMTSITAVADAATSDGSGAVDDESAERVDDDTDVASEGVDSPALVPYPRSIAVSGERLAPCRFGWAAVPPSAEPAWRAVAALTERRGGAMFAASPQGPGNPVVQVTATVDPSMVTEAYRVTVTGGDAATDTGRVEVVAGDEAGFRHAFITLAQLAGAGLPADATIEDAPEFAWRGLHIDLARHWFEPDVVERLIDLAAWRKLSRLHLHLTDDEAWRLPVPEYPELTRVGGSRGHGLPIPPMLGSGPEPYGRGYTADEIARWVARADDLGVILVPEVDLPGHVFAALASHPELGDPDDRSGAVSEQYFIDNVVVPGRHETLAFLDTVFTAVARLFPNSPWIHIGADEVPPGAWSASPMVAALDPGATSLEIERRFVRELVGHIARLTGRSVVAWEEAAAPDGMAPGDGVVISWRDAEVGTDSGRRLAAAGYDVVLSPGAAYYLDMAIDAAWDTVGSSWAGTTSLDDVIAYQPGADWTSEERRHLIGVQACLWTEHVRSEQTLLDRLFPRLDAIAERAWRGSVVGGAASLATRSAVIR